MFVLLPIGAAVGEAVHIVIRVIARAYVWAAAAIGPRFHYRFMVAARVNRPTVLHGNSDCTAA